MSTNSSTPLNGRYDVAVIGGGPGGATLATFLARAGYRCVIFERDKFPRYHIGESLIPHTYGIFERLGFLQQLRASPFPVVRRSRRDRGECAELRDLRFAYDWPAAPFGADVDLDAGGAPRRERAYI
jgi:2-polyprenyl-6-methoxyphenol hydroxylase-like FAD-dependent oxidoreductase